MAVGDPGVRDRDGDGSLPVLSSHASGASMSASLDWLSPQSPCAADRSASRRHGRSSWARRRASQGAPRALHRLLDGRASGNPEQFRACQAKPLFRSAPTAWTAAARPLRPTSALNGTISSPGTNSSLSSVPEARGRSSAQQHRDAPGAQPQRRSSRRAASDQPCTIAGLPYRSYGLFGAESFSAAAASARLTTTFTRVPWERARRAAGSG